MAFKSAIRKIVPRSVLAVYHWSLAKLAAVFYGFPSNKMIVVGVTGTLGKSTTVQFLGQMLEATGKKVGWASTVGFKVDEKEWVNDKKMTMLGRFQLQNLLQQMVAAGCEYAIIEVSSQGVEQFRHIGINFDVAVLTNLSPEHIEAHGGFENYKKAKGKFFDFVAKSPLKKLKGKEIHKSFVVNIDNEHAPYFLSLVEGEERVGNPPSLGFGGARGRKGRERTGAKIFKFSVDAEEVKLTPRGSEFVWEDRAAFIEPLGINNVYNATAAASVLKALSFSDTEIIEALKKIKSVPGRLELINEGQDFLVIVDFAYEPKSVAALYETVKILPHQKIIHVLGSTGGGRDVARRPLLGKIAGEKANVVIVTNEDPYDDDPQEIINQVAAGARSVGKEEGKNLFCLLDRATAIQKAVSLAESGDLVLITGKGSEPIMAVAGGKTIPWDDRATAKKIIKQQICHNNNDIRKFAPPSLDFGGVPPKATVGGINS